MLSAVTRMVQVVARPGRAAVIALLMAVPEISAAEPWSTLVDPENSLSFLVLREERPVFRIGLGGWGPKWALVGVQSQEKGKDGKLSLRVPFVVNKDKGEIIDVGFEASRPTARKVVFRYDLESTKDVPLTMLIAGVNFEADAKGKLTLTGAENKQTRIDMPVRGNHSAP